MPTSSQGASKKGAGMRLGYVRVSTILQNEARQLELLESENCDKLFIEKISGATIKRPVLQEMLDFAREGDTIVCHSIDRMARNHRDLQQIINVCRDKGVRVKFVSQGLDTESGSIVTDMIISILGYVAQMELAHIKERQAEGIAIKKASGYNFGRPTIEIDKERFNELFYTSGGNLTKVAKALKVSRPKLYKWIKSQKTQNCEVS